MPAKSKKQQRFFGMVHARQKGEDVGGAEVEKVADSISKKDAKDFASTKHKGLPEKKKKKDKKKDEHSLWEHFKLLKESTCHCNCKGCNSGDCSNCTCQNCKCKGCNCASNN